MYKGDNSLRNFFLYFAIGFAVSSIKVNLAYTDPYEIVGNIILNTLYCFCSGIFTGLGAMIGIDCYNYLKKNFKL